jgi:hypothetical protein
VNALFFINVANGQYINRQIIHSKKNTNNYSQNFNTFSFSFGHYEINNDKINRYFGSIKSIRIGLSMGSKKFIGNSYFTYSWKKNKYPTYYTFNIHEPDEVKENLNYYYFNWQTFFDFCFKINEYMIFHIGPGFGLSFFGLRGSIVNEQYSHAIAQAASSANILFTSEDKINGGGINCGASSGLYIFYKEIFIHFSVEILSKTIGFSTHYDPINAREVEKIHIFDNNGLFYFVGIGKKF